MVLLDENEHDVEDNDDAPDVVDKPGEVGRGRLPKVRRFENGNYACIDFHGDVGSLECGWRAKDTACSKLEQYRMRERAMLMLAKGALETKRFSMMEMMQAVDGVPKDLRRGLVVYGQGITGMYRAIARYMGEDEFEPWTRLEYMFGQYVPGMARVKKRMLDGSD